MGENRKMTPIGLATKNWAKNQSVGAGIGVAGTFNTLTTGVAVKYDPNDAIYDRHHSIRFTDAADLSAIFTHIVNRRYRIGGSLICHVHWTTTSSTTGNAYLDFGLTHKGSDGLIGDGDTDTEYIGLTAYTGPAVLNEVIVTEITFDPDINGGIDRMDALTLIVQRKGSDGNDTLTDSVLILGVDWIYDIESLGTKTI